MNDFWSGVVGILLGAVILVAAQWVYYRGPRR